MKRGTSTYNVYSFGRALALTITNAKVGWVRGVRSLLTWRGLLVDLLLVLLHVVLVHAAERVGRVRLLVDDGVVLVLALDDALGRRAHHDDRVVLTAVLLRRVRKLVSHSTEEDDRIVIGSFQICKIFVV